MNTEIRIMEYSDEYQDSIVNLILHIQQEEFGIQITKDDQPDLLEIADFYQRGSGNFWIALLEGTVVGTIALLDIGCGNLALRKMFVAEKYRGGQWNIGSLLLNTAIEWAKSKKIAKIYLGTTTQFKAAHRFYEKNNFIEIAEEELPEEFPKMHVDKKFYRLSNNSAR